MTDTNYLASAVSTRVARDFRPEVWRDLFAEACEPLVLRTATWSVVCAESPWDGRMSSDQVRVALRRLAARHEGLLDGGSSSISLAIFAEPRAALRTALDLQRESAVERLRVGVITAHAGLAHFRAEGEGVNLLVGTPLDRAPALLQRAAAGTVQLCAQTYEALAGSAPELDSCLVMAEYDNDELTQVALTLPPARGAALSSFAGLGLT